MAYTCYIFMGRTSWVGSSLTFSWVFTSLHKHHTHTHTHTQKLESHTQEGRHRMVGRCFVICSLDSTGMCLGNGLVLDDQTIKPSHPEASSGPLHPVLTVKAEKVSGIHRPPNLFEAVDASAQTFPLYVSFPGHSNPIWGKYISNTLLGTNLYILTG